VVRALEDSVDDPPPRQRQIAMGAAVEEGGRPTLRVAEEDERLVEDHAGERPPAEVGRSAGDVPLVGEPDDGERALRLRHRIRLLPRSPRGRNRPAAA